MAKNVTNSPSAACTVPPRPPFDLGGDARGRTGQVSAATPRIGATGFYSGPWNDYPTGGFGGITTALELVDNSGIVTADLHTYDLETALEVYLTGSGVSNNGAFSVTLASNGGACPTNFTIAGSSGTTLTAVVNGTDCKRTYSNLQLQLHRH